MESLQFAGKESLTQQAYKKLKSMILLHQLKPGLIIKESQLQELLSIGRTPVREAIIQLSKEHFLIIHPRRGIEISRISAKRIKDIFTVRSLLEPQVLRMGINNLDRNLLKEIRAQFVKYDEHKPTKDETIILSELDNQFHAHIMNSVDNGYLTDLMRSFQDYLTLFRSSTQIEEVRFEVSNKEHIAIIDDILANNIDLACEKLSRHLSKSYEEAIKAIMHIDFQH